MFSLRCLVAAAAAGMVVVVCSSGLAGAGGLKDDPGNTQVSWNGIYVGAHAGYGWSGVDSLHRDNNWWTSAPGQNFASGTDGTSVGAQLGYNFQAGRLVFGGEVSYSGTFMDDADPSPYFPNNDRFSADIEGIVTITGRVGYSISNQTLLYLKGGYAAANIEVSNDDLAIGNTNLSIDSRWYGGWTVGGGVEQKLAPRLSLALEYNMINLDAKTVSMTNTGAAINGVTIISRVNPDTMHTVTARLNFKLGD